MTNKRFFLKLFISIPLLLFLTSCGSRTPTGLDQETVKSQSKKDYDELKAGTENIVKEIDLYQAIAIGIKHNRNLRIQMMESALSQGQIDVVKFDMLPQFAASAGYKHLSQFPGSTSFFIKLLSNIVIEEKRETLVRLKRFGKDGLGVWTRWIWGSSTGAGDAPAGAAGLRAGAPGGREVRPRDRLRTKDVIE